MPEQVEVIQTRDIIEVVRPTVEVVQVIERGPQGPQGPLADQEHVQEYVDAAVSIAVDDYNVLHPQSWTHDQPQPSANWLFIHPLPYPPDVVVIDTAGEVQEGVVSYPAPGQVRVEFNVPVAGTAYCR